MNATTDAQIITLARAIAPTHWELWDALQELEKTTDFIAPNDAIEMLTRPSKGLAIKITNMSSSNPTNFLVGGGHNVHYTHTPGESTVEQIARLLSPNDWFIYDRLHLWGVKTGNVTPDHLLSLLTKESLDSAAHYYQLAMELKPTR